jgi:hypothetical protein
MSPDHDVWPDMDQITSMGHETGAAVWPQWFRFRSGSRYQVIRRHRLNLL